MSVSGSIGSLIEYSHNLSAYCKDCGHTAQLDLEKLALKFGRDHSYLAPHLTPKLRCVACGSKQIGLQVSPDSVSNVAL